jgi:hypothetical protein
MGCTDCPDPKKTQPEVEYLGWRAFYDDMSVYCSREHTWAELPEDGVLVVMVYMKDAATGDLRKRALEASFYFIQEQNDGRPPLISQSEESVEAIRKRYPRASIKVGRWTDEETWSRVEKTAFESVW